ncbi:MAG: hypothetical protein ISR58_00095 [Anaerolineales bacterium]|nr:hypothetical protein [Chloroflexota bacterium]MBL6979562.1 hypothetical protein [Anaerolineales bacterium]
MMETINLMKSAKREFPTNNLPKEKTRYPELWAAHITLGYRRLSVVSEGSYEGADSGFQCTQG